MAFSLVFIVCLVTTAAAYTTHIGACGIDYYGLSGVITSPNYPGNYDNYIYCNFMIVAPPGSSLSFFFKSFAVEEGLDFVTISCDTNSSFPSQRFSGYSLPNPVSIPWCSLGKVNFYTDGSVVLNGFSLHFNVSVGGCGNTVYSGSNGYVTTPNWPSNYANNLDCYNIIWAPHPYTFRMIFQSFELQKNCTLDWLEISCLDNSDYDQYRYCGNITTVGYGAIISGCTQMLLWFHSDNNENYSGFNIEYDVYPHEACGETSFYGPSGVISSPNYPGNYDFYQYCENTIYASAESSLSFIFKSFNTELYNDFVRISCPTNSSYPPQEYSGNVLPHPVSIPWCSQGLVYFSANLNIHYTGFSLDYFVSLGGCGNTVYNDSSGYVTTPNYPSYYRHNQNCSNIIWAPQRSTFHLTVWYFNLHNCCSCDWLEISCLDNSAYGQYKYCGYQSPFDLHIHECSQLVLWFHSDGSNNNPGFKIQYNVYPNEGNTSVTGTTIFPPTPSPSSTLPGSTASPSTTTASTTTGFVPPSSTASTSTTTASTTTAIVPQDCGDTSYYGPSGVISSPNHPNNYSNYLSCNYYVNASSLSSSIAIIFEQFSIEECCDYLTISCPTNPIYPSWRYSGSTLPQPLSIPGCSRAVVNFITDSSTVSTGFSLDYHISLGGCGDTLYTEPTGYVSSPNYPSDYDSNQNCSNIIWSRLRSSFSITFPSMKVEECCDFVELSCLDNAGYGTHRFTGTTIPPKQIIPQCTQVRVWFYSDETVVDEGFSLEYTATPDSDGQK